MVLNALAGAATFFSTFSNVYTGLQNIYNSQQQNQSRSQGQNQGQGDATTSSSSQSLLERLLGIQPQNGAAADEAMSEWEKKEWEQHTANLKEESREEIDKLREQLKDIMERQQADSDRRRSANPLNELYTMLRGKQQLSQMDERSLAIQQLAMNKQFPHQQHPSENNNMVLTMLQSVMGRLNAPREGVMGMNADPRYMNGVQGNPYAPNPYASQQQQQRDLSNPITHPQPTHQNPYQPTSNNPYTNPLLPPIDPRYIPTDTSRNPNDPSQQTLPPGHPNAPGQSQSYMNGAYHDPSHQQPSTSTIPELPAAATRQGQAGTPAATRSINPNEARSRAMMDDNDDAGYQPGQRRGGYLKGEERFLNRLGTNSRSTGRERGDAYERYADRYGDDEGVRGRLHRGDLRGGRDRYGDYEYADRATRREAGERGRMQQAEQAATRSGAQGQGGNANDRGINIQISNMGNQAPGTSGNPVELPAEEVTRAPVELPGSQPDGANSAEPVSVTVQRTRSQQAAFDARQARRDFGNRGQGGRTVPLPTQQSNDPSSAVDSVPSATTGMPTNNSKEPVAVAKETSPDPPAVAAPPEVMPERQGREERVPSRERAPTHGASSVAAESSQEREPQHAGVATGSTDTQTPDDVVNAPVPRSGDSGYGSGTERNGEPAQDSKDRFIYDKHGVPRRKQLPDRVQASETGGTPENHSTPTDGSPIVDLSTERDLGTSQDFDSMEGRQPQPSPTTLERNADRPLGRTSANLGTPPRRQRRGGTSTVKPEYSRSESESSDEDSDDTENSDTEDFRPTKSHRAARSSPEVAVMPSPSWKNGCKAVRKSWGLTLLLGGIIFVFVTGMYTISGEIGIMQVTTLQRRAEAEDVSSGMTPGSRLSPLGWLSMMFAVQLVFWASLLATWDSIWERFSAPGLLSSRNDSKSRSSSGKSKASRAWHSAVDGPWEQFQMMGVKSHIRFWTTIVLPIGILIWGGWQLQEFSRLLGSPAAEQAPTISALAAWIPIAIDTSEPSAQDGMRLLIVSGFFYFCMFGLILFGIDGLRTPQSYWTDRKKRKWSRQRV